VPTFFNEESDRCVTRLSHSVRAFFGLAPDSKC
jgi:hypothetical protein